MQPGISIIICCHNSAKELPQTIAHLAAQRVSETISWEVLVIDNASTDATAQVAMSLWPQNPPAPLRVVHEPKLGLINARYCGLAEASYEVLSFIDDDNWVCENWVETVFEVMGAHPEVGACGGQNFPVLEEGAPDWFEEFSRSYAIGAQGPATGGDITWTRGRLFGAGLSIRKKAWQQLVDSGFRSMLVGSKGKILSRGEDSELCYALVLAGWRLWYEPKLQLQHNLPNERLQWTKLRKQRRGTGRAKPILAAYELALQESGVENSIGFYSKFPQNPDGTFRARSWLQESLAQLRVLIRYRKKVFQSFFEEFEGDAQILMIEHMLGNMLGLLKQRRNYNKNIENIRNSQWRKTDFPNPNAAISKEFQNC
jgi:glycosyltransferase involved in cell wall biosynthesis